MKNLLIFLIILFSITSSHSENDFNASQFTIGQEEICSFKLVEQNDVSEIILIELENKSTIFNVHVSIKTHLITKISKMSCSYMNDISNECSIVEDITNKLINYSGIGLRKGTSRGFRWIIKKGGYFEKCSVVVEAKTLESAKKIAENFSLYNSIGGLKWEASGYSRTNYYNSQISERYECNRIRITNYSDSLVYFSLTNDEKIWNAEYLERWKSFALSTTSNKVFIKVNGYKYYVLNSNTKYVLNYDDELDEIVLSKGFKASLDVFNPYPDLKFTYLTSPDNKRWVTVSISPEEEVSTYANHMLYVFVKFQNKTYKLRTDKKYIINFDDSDEEYKIIQK